MESIVNRASVYTLYYVDIISQSRACLYCIMSTYLLVVNFFSFAGNVNVHVQFFFLILCSHKCGSIHTRFHASMLISKMVFVCWKIMGV